MKDFIKDKPRAKEALAMRVAAGRAGHETFGSNVFRTSFERYLTRNGLVIPKS